MKSYTPGELMNVASEALIEAGFACHTAFLIEPARLAEGIYNVLEFKFPPEANLDEAVLILKELVDGHLPKLTAVEVKDSHESVIASFCCCSPKEKELKNIVIETIADFAESRGYDTRFDYSGRYMCGAECLGIVCNNPLEMLVDLALYLSYELDEDLPKARSMITAPNMDDMGRSRIVYWPRIDTSDYHREEAK